MTTSTAPPAARPNTTPDGQAAAKGIPGLVTPYTTSEFQAVVEACRLHHHAAMDQYSTVAAELQRLLARVSGRPWMVGVDSKVAARRVTRQLLRAANFEVAAAQATLRGYQLFVASFTPSGQTARAKTFDLDK